MARRNVDQSCKSNLHVSNMVKCYIKMFTFVAFILFSKLALSNCEVTTDDMRKYRDEVKEMFYHGYNNYLEHAFPYDELRPLTCDGFDTWGSYSLTLVDSLDTLAVLGNYTEFRRVAELLLYHLDFEEDINVSVFETNIRVVGGLLSAHLLSKKAQIPVGPEWPCKGPLLTMAKEIATKLLPTFDTLSGMPYGTINLVHGVPQGETAVTCTSGVGTFIVEFGTLSRLTGEPIFEETALKALQALWKCRSGIGLVGNHINVLTKKWTALDSGIGGGIDSYLEYLVKGSLLLGNQELMDMFREYEEAVKTYNKRDDWYMWVNMKKGQVSLPVFQSLDAYWPGLQSLIGDVDPAMKTLHNFHQVWKQIGFTPSSIISPTVSLWMDEKATLYDQVMLCPVSMTTSGIKHYISPSAASGKLFSFYQMIEGVVFKWLRQWTCDLRITELIESVMYLYQATRDPFLLEVGRDIMTSIQVSARTPCGYASMKDSRHHTKDNRMESFFLSETTKYLYLLFDPDNFLHANGSEGTLVSSPHRKCILDAGGYIFNTEAHPIDISAIDCCQRGNEMRSMENLLNNINQKEARLKWLERYIAELYPNVEKEELTRRHNCTSQPFSAKLSILGEMFPDWET
ncbi:putative ER degradation-enhancing alpha-mannosidase-like protein 2 [Apostichopus japonicus]|uniref:alpha-1,2-Mannosidase n=1 Tax=Stichopus japonicus TaxID=307972 RepID=A0A2G8JH97_STIJA|nr:putative ER degradation-enhancing alpha-mannosidase-like protein 2 [Apostichopus japonicus]